jgi:hypothetical protein
LQHDTIIKIFPPKILAKKLAFLLQMMLIHAKIDQKNWLSRKTQFSVKIAENIDHNIDPCRDTNPRILPGKTAT